MCEEKGELRDVQLTDFNDKNYQQVENKDCGTTGSDGSHDFVLCKNKKVAYPLVGSTEGDFSCVADCPSTMRVVPGTNNCECIKRMEETRTEDVVQECVKECPLTHYDDSGTCRECSSLCQDVSSAGSRVCTGPAPDQCHACSYRSADGTCTSGCTPGQKAVPGTSNGTFICQACRSGYRCVNGDQMDEICPAGKYSNAEGTACDPCPAGQYSGSAGSTSCTICPAGRFSARAESTSCTVCPADTFSSSAGSTSCKQCPAGTESTAGSTSCSPQYSGCQDPAILSGDSGTITSPGYPGRYESNLRCSWTITVSRGRLAAIRFTDLDIEASQSCMYDYLAVYDGPTSSDKQLGKFCGDTIPSPVVASGRTMHLVFISDIAIRRTGFSAKYTGFRNFQCVSNNGTCTSGCNPGQKAVPGTSDGTFICQACRSGYRCVNGDQVDEICPAGTYSNAEGTDCDLCPAGQYSGSASTVCQPCPAGQFSHTTGSTSCQQCPAGTGSTAGSTSCSPQYSGCQPAILSGDYGTITSPGYPGMYPPNLRCSWTITVSRGRLAAIRFTSIDIQEHSRCAYDYLAVYDGATSSGTQLGKFCGNTIPSPVMASGRTMHLVFISDHSVNGHGFSVEYAGLW
ncbi:CUB domain-containing protein 2-like [Branchiostoma floridae x Branchiostoma belcheri]